MAMQNLNTERNKSLFAVICCITVVGAGLGLSIPLQATILERQGIPGWLIGLNGMMPALATIISTPFIPRLLQRIPTSSVLLLCIAVAAFCMPLFYLFQNIWVWFPIRFFYGLALTGLFVISEFWISQLADDTNRGRIIALYGTILSAGFAIGPLALLILGTTTALPFVFVAILILLAGIPILTAGSLAPKVEESPSGSVLSFLTLAPAATLAALVFGMVETNIFQFLPIFTLRSGLGEQIAAIVLTTFAAGNMLLQFPVGMLADRMDRRIVLFWCAAFGMTAAAMLPYVSHDIWIFLPVLFFFGGTVTGLYTVGLTMLGDRFKGADLAAANSAFIMLYSVGALFSPPIAGFAIDLWNPAGLSYFLTVICGIYLVVVVIRSWQSRKK